MSLFRRADGEPIPSHKLSSLRRFMPFLMKGRNEAAVYFEHPIDVTETLAWLEACNTGLAEKRCTFFHIILAATVRTIAALPKLNTFVAGQRLHTRNAIALSFAVKKQFSDEAALTTVKIVFQPDDTLDTVARRVKRAIDEGRSEKPSTSDKEMDVISRLPRSVVRRLMRAQRFLDDAGLLPAALTQDDPLYASAMLANLGSIGLRAPFHHLFEYGTVPIFMAVGRIQRVPVVDKNDAIVPRDVVDIKFSIDERIADGFYLARSLELFQEYVQEPERLQHPSERDRSI